MQELVAMGFTALEADIYGFLLRESPATGYRVAQALGKPAANVYQALESLQAKGAAVTDDGGGSRRCRAVPADELLDRLAREFQRNQEKVREEAARISVRPDDSRIYQLSSVDQVLERGRAMLGRAEKVILVDGFPEPLAQLEDELTAAAARGLRVMMKAYAPTTIPGAEVVLEPERERVLRRWPGQWISVVADGSELLMAMLCQRCATVHQAVWSESAYLSLILQNGMAHELAYTSMRLTCERVGSHKEIRDSIARTDRFFFHESPGYYRLLRQMGRDPDETFTHKDKEFRS